MIGQIIENKDTAFVGDIVQNKVQISQQNIDFIMNILTSNLYSKPLESFFREIISNAYDAQVEAGNPDHPIIMLLEQGDTYNTIRISIRDWGTGISPERFDEVYKYLGTSTKRESNEFIGYFGIGKFSVLSLTDTCVINSYYNNVKHSYLMYKNDMSINIDKVGEFKGNFENGLEVSVTLTNLTPRSFNEALQKMAFFENLHVVVKDLPYYQSAADTFNKRVINNYENFSTCNVVLSQDCVLIGKVIYQYKEFESYRTKGGYYFPRIPIGSVMVTPNRENILLTSDATALIEDMISKAKEEIRSLAKEIAISKNYTTFEEFYKDAISNIEICNGYYKYSDFPMMLCGRRILPTTINIITNAGLSFNHIPSFTKKLSSRYDLNIRTILSGGIKVFVKAERTLQAVTKAWLESKSDSFIVINDNIISAFEDNLVFPSNFVSYKNRKRAIFMEYLKRYLSYTKVSNNDVPESFRNTFFDKRNYFDKSLKTLENSKIRLYNRYGYALRSWNNVKDLKGLIVYDVHTKDDSLIKEFCPTYNNYTSIVNKVHFITVSKECYNAMPKNRKFMDFLTFMSNRNNFYAKIITSNMITENYYLLDSYKYGMTKRNSFNNSRLRRFREYSLSSTVVDLYKANKWYDECALREYLYTDEEIKVLQEVSKLERSKDAILESAIYNKFKSVKFLNLKKPKVYFKDCNV